MQDTVLSAKINYDVLRDLANSLAVEGSPSNHHSSPSTSENQLSISKTHPTTTGRLSSLTTRKRNFSALVTEPAATSSQLPAKSVTILLQKRLTLDIKTTVMEESRPVDYCQVEGKGVNNTDLEPMVIL